MKEKISLFILALIIVGGFYFRFQGIEKNLSYWNDEIHTAYFSRAVVEKGIPITQSGHTTGLYQIALYYLTALSFSMFGISEFAGRIPSVIGGTLLILLVFVVAKRITNTYAAFIASLLTAFSQIQLAWSTQLRPYIWLEIFTLLIAYLSYLNLHSKKIVDRYLVSAVGVSLVASLFHGTGLVNFVLISVVFMFKVIALKKYRYLLLAIPMGTFVLGILYFSLSPINRTAGILFSLNTDILHYRVFLQANYWWLIMGSMVGSIALWTYSRKHAVIFAGFPIIIFLVAIFKFNSQYVRYSLPAFPFLYILFGLGVVFTINNITARIKNRFVKQGIIVLLLLFFVSYVLKTNKVLTAPRYYYTINGDMRENPIVDYKLAFQKIEKLMHNKKSVIVMDAWNDRVPWFMPNQPYIFLIEHRPANIDPVFGEPMVSTIEEFLAAKKKHPAGVILVENWESQTAYNLQQHIRNTLKHEFDVENLPYNGADKWSISIYSWGFDRRSYD